MAKELPYFKFEPNQWENGNIQICTFEAQGIFINLCSMYWQRLGDLPFKLAVQKICGGNATALQSLCDNEIIEVIDGMICINFLNEQLDDFENVSKVNSENARSGWEKRRKDATAKRPQSDRNAIREEKRKEDEIKVDDRIEKNLEWFLKQFDEIYVENLKMTHKGKDFMQAAKEAYSHLSADPVRLKMAETQDCKRLLNTWLSNQKIQQNGTKKGFDLNAAENSIADYIAKNR